MDDFTQAAQVGQGDGIRASEPANLGVARQRFICNKEEWLLGLGLQQLPCSTVGEPIVCKEPCLNKVLELTG